MEHTKISENFDILTIVQSFFNLIRLFYNILGHHPAKHSQKKGEPPALIKQFQKPKSLDRGEAALSNTSKGLNYVIIQKEQEIILFV